MNLAIVSIATGFVQTFVRPDVPEGWQPPEGYTAVPEDQLPVGWQREPDNKTPEEIWAEKLDGFITVNGLDLKANRSAKNDFTGMFTLISGGIAAGAMTGSTPVDIWDAHNAKHTLPASDILALLLAYGFAWQAMFNEFAP